MQVAAVLRGARQDASGPEARREAELLLQAVTGMSRAGLISHGDRPLTDAEHAQFSALWQRRLQGEPIAYLLGWREFYGLRLAVSPAVLIPRPETELLVDAALSRLPDTQSLNVLDLGTGSGAIALAIAANRPEASVHAGDVSAAALDVARQNAKALGLAQVCFHLSDWFQGIEPGLRFDLILSNPPYIAEHDAHLQQGDLRFEPLQALTPGGDGLASYRHVIKAAPEWLNAGGWLLFEHGYDQADAIRALFVDAGYSDVSTLQDIEGRDRVTVGQWRI
ncbi:peptide chain release factor N(5)-glutamine methyltransferase [Ahniella affigens]|uniref:peptide chain release factor N(5)-glutamine methyltransferase n=1 Tax=Ahniella affigens TaxID=2021234 RepID=UPI003CCD8F23